MLQPAQQQLTVRAAQNIFVSNNIFTNLDRAAWQLPISTGMTRTLT